MKLLALVGSGIKTISHLTEEAKGYITSCDSVLYLVNEPLLEGYIKKLAKTSRSLEPAYVRQTDRKSGYGNIAQEIIDELNRVCSVCVVIYGHPCVFATPGLLAISSLNVDVKTVICPGISALDCLFADLRFDPANGGTQTFDATEYLLYDKIIDTSAHIVIYQIGMVGNLGLPTNKVNLDAICFVKNKLLALYDKNKTAIIYESALYPGTTPKIFEFELSELEKQDLSPISTLYIPPNNKKMEPDALALNLLT